MFKSNVRMSVSHVPLEELSVYYETLLSVYHAVSCGNKKNLLSQKKGRISPDRNTISQEELEQMSGWDFDLRSKIKMFD